MTIEKILTICKNYSRSEFFINIRARINRWKSFFLGSRFKSYIGKNTYLDPSVHVLRWRNVRLGNNSLLCQDVCININDYTHDNPSLIIGDSVFIGRRVFFSPARLVRIGSFCMVGLECKFLGSNHLFSDPFLPFISTGTTDNQVIELGVNCWLGAAVTIVGDVKVGHGCVIGAGAYLKEDIPPFSIVVGNPSRIIKRYNMLSKKWIPVNEFNQELEELIPTEIDYLKKLQEKNIRINMPWQASSKFMGDTL